jgi:death-on-curing protein
VIYLELGDLLAIASEVLGLEADALIRVTDLGLADSAVSRPHASFEGEEFYPSIGAKAATLLFGIARNHAFIDGNKRAAVLATLQFLNSNGHDLNLDPPEQAFKTITGAAAGNSFTRTASGGCRSTFLDPAS